MRILIVSATGFEVEPVLTRLKGMKKVGLELFCGNYGKYKVDVLISGVGMVSTAYHCAKTIDKKYSLVLNAGIAGSFKKSIPVGTVVNVVTDRFSELGAQWGERLLTLKELKLTGEDFFESKYALKNQLIDSLKKVNGITVNTVHGNFLSINKVKKKFNPDVESMEGASVFFVCHRSKINCLQVRAISNLVEYRNKRAWDIPLAISNLNETILKILDKSK